MTRAWRSLALASALLLSGCGTILNLGDHPQAMGGVRFDANEMTHGGPCSAAPLFCMDMPFSLALDLALLPFTAIYEIANPKPPPPPSVPDPNPR